MIKGAIDFLLSDSREAKTLRKKFIFRIVPMLNPDGVIYGNYRCSLLGIDLNRRWKNPNQHLHPTVYYCKKLIQMFSEDHELIMYCDMHGHSMKKNVFMYACNYKSNTFSVDDNKTNIFIRLIPYLLSRKNPLFSYESCHFRMEKFKETTARIVNFKEFNILASYTLEASFFGSDFQDPMKDPHLDRNQLESLGRDLCRQLMIFVSPREFKNRIIDLKNYLNSPSGCKRSISAKRSYIREEKEKFEFTIQEAIQEIPEEQLEDLVRPEEHSDSGGSDAEGSDNDDKKISFLMNRKAGKKKKTEKNKSIHICSNRHSSNSKLRNVSCTPEVIKSHSKPRISVIKNSFNSIVLRPPNKKFFEKAQIKEDEPVQNYSYLDIKFRPEYRKPRETQVRTSRGQVSTSSDPLEPHHRPVQRIFERFIALHFKK